MEIEELRGGGAAAELKVPEGASAGGWAFQLRAPGNSSSSRTGQGSRRLEESAARLSGNEALSGHGSGCSLWTGTGIGQLLIRGRSRRASI